MGKDVFYDTMHREDLNWHKFQEQVAHKTVQTFNGRVIFAVCWAGLLKKAFRGVNHYGYRPCPD